MKNSVIFIAVILVVSSCKDKTTDNTAGKENVSVKTEKEAIETFSINTKPEAPKELNDFEKLVRISSSCRNAEEDKSIFFADTTKKIKDTDTKNTESVNKNYQGLAFKYSVKQEETLEDIAIKFNLDATTIATDNLLKEKLVNSGQNIIIRLKSKYTVKDGESIDDIATKFEISSGLLKAINNITEIDSLKGKMLYIPY